MPTERCGLVKYRARLNRHLRNLRRNPYDGENLGNLPGQPMPRLEVSKGEPTEENAQPPVHAALSGTYHVGLESDCGPEAVLSNASGWSESGSAMRMLSLPAKRSSIRVPITPARQPRASCGGSPLMNPSR